MFRKVDCVVVRVPSLADSLRFYAGKLGHRLAWRRGDEAAGLSMVASDTEIVLMAEGSGTEADLLVDSVEDAVRTFTTAGGSLVGRVEEIPIGKRATLRDPWGNVLLILDMSKGPLRTDPAGNVIEDRV